MCFEVQKLAVRFNGRETLKTIIYDLKWKLLDEKITLSQHKQ